MNQAWALGVEPDAKVLTPSARSSRAGGKGAGGVMERVYRQGWGGKQRKGALSAEPAAQSWGELVQAMPQRHGKQETF